MDILKIKDLSLLQTKHLSDRLTASETSPTVESGSAVSDARAD